MKNIILISITLLFSTTFLSAATITVISGADAGAGTLREAIENAAANDTITFADNITTITLTGSGFTLNKNITIIGNEENNTIITVNNHRHFYMPENANITVNFNNLTLKNGYAPNCGGAIFNRTGNTLTLNNCEFINNSAGSACGAVDNTGKLTINNCLFENNSVSSSGVGAVLNANEMSINNSTFTNNEGSSAGALRSYSNSITNITNCVFKENKGAIASAFWNSGTATVINSLFIFNEYISSNVIFDRSATISTYTGLNDRERIILTIINSTIADNTADDGLYNDAQIALYNTIIWNNERNDVYTTNDGTTTATNNLIGTSNINLSGNGNIIGIDKDPLFDNDYSLQENSPAIDTGINTYLPIEITKDLLGNLRISNGTVDMGAYEFQNNNPTSFIKNTNNAALNIYAKNRTIYIENITEPVNIYNMFGHLVAQGLKKEFTVPQAGIYMVKTGKVAKKVIVNN